MGGTEVVTTPFQLIGGAQAVDRLVDAFYAAMDARAEAVAIRAMHAPDLGPVRATLKLYLGEWLGGPKLYSAQKGHPRLRQRHLGFKIGEAERDAWLMCMSAALDAVVSDEPVRRELFNQFAKLADWMRNQSENAHDTPTARP